MSSEPFRFLHAAGFRLDQPLEGFDDASPALRELLIDAPYRAARKVFDAALAHGVEFVVLAGDLLDLEQFDPRAVSFLIEQFQRLAEKKIAVYWAGSVLDSPERWPSFAPLPENVRFFSSEQPESVLHSRQGAPLAAVAGLSSPAKRKPRSINLQSDAQGRFTIVVTQTDEPHDQLARRKVHYWALGGGDKTTFQQPVSQQPVSPQPASQQSTSQQPACTIHDPGPPQGRSTREAGACGCTLVEVDGQKRIKLQAIPTDEARWRQEKVLIPGGTTRKELERSLRERAAELAAAEKRSLLVEWIVEAPATSRTIWGAPGLADDLLQLLRREFGQSSPGLFSASLKFAPAGELPPPWYQEDTLLGDFLREIRLKQHKPDASAKESQTPAGWTTADLAEPGAGGLSESEAEQRAWRDAVLLGLEMLRGEAESPL